VDETGAEVVARFEPYANIDPDVANIYQHLAVQGFTVYLSGGVVRDTYIELLAKQGQDPRNVHGVEVVVEDDEFYSDLQAEVGAEFEPGEKDSPPDYDAVVYGLHETDEDESRLRELIDVLSPFGRCQLTGQDFLVAKLFPADPDMRRRYPDGLDFLQPRAERKLTPEEMAERGIDSHHMAYDVQVGSNVLKDESDRRDLGANAGFWNPTTGEILGFNDGFEQLAQGVLRHTTDQHFSEDPERMARALRFACRFGMRIAPETLAWGPEMARLFAEHTEREHRQHRIRGEVMKMLTQGRYWTGFFDNVAACGWGEAFWPELNEVRGVPQDPAHHPEGDVAVHTEQCLNVGAELVRRPEFVSAFRQRARERNPDATPRQSDMEVKKAQATVMAAILGHDLAKAQYTEEQDGRITSYGHEDSTAARSLLTKMGLSQDIVDGATALIETHTLTYGVRGEMKSRTARKLARKLNQKLGDHATAEMWAAVAIADKAGRSPTKTIRATVPDDVRRVMRATWNDARLSESQQHAHRILNGGYLVQEHRMQPGPAMGHLIDKAVGRLYLEGHVDTPSQAEEVTDDILVHCPPPASQHGAEYTAWVRGVNDYVESMIQSEQQGDS